jgi:hypothetical protein
MERSRKLQLEWARKTVSVPQMRIKRKNGGIILTELFGSCSRPRTTTMKNDRNPARRTIS